MDSEPEQQAKGVEAALDKWRQKAANRLMAVNMAVYLPGIILLSEGKGPRITWQMRLIVWGAYAVVFFNTMLWWRGYRARTYAFLAAGYCLAVTGSIAVPHGPFVRAVLVILPLITMVLMGAPTGRIAALCSILALLLTPVLGTLPCLSVFLAKNAVKTPPHWTSTITPGIALIALLIVAMALLEHFHRFLIQSLTEIQHEADERTTAYQRLECEMAERRRLECELSRAADDERRRLGHEIHDGICQQLTAALLRSEALARRLDRQIPLEVHDLHTLSSLLDETIDEARAIAKGLCPLDSDPDALAEALRALALRAEHTTGIPCRFETTGEVRVPDPTVAQHLYRIAQEALNNAAKHAKASRIALRLKGEQSGLLLEITDNGQGFPKEIPAAGMGLRTMTYRARLLEGELKVSPAPGGGTQIRCHVPRATQIRRNESPAEQPRGSSWTPENH